MMHRHLLRRAVALLLAAVMLAAGAVSAEAVGVGDFADISAGDWYYDAVGFVVGRGLFQGTSATAFSPNGTMTRAMFITVLGRYAGVNGAAWATGYHTFSDVSASSYYAGYASWAFEKQIVSGDGLASIFSPNANITREQACTILSRFASVMGISLSGGASVTFTDEASISSWARDSVAAMTRAGIIKGRDTGAFDPSGSTTRAEAAAILQRFTAAASGYTPPAQQPESSTPPAQQPENSAPPVGEGGETPPLTQVGSGPLDNIGVVSRLSQGSRHCCLATCFSMAANLVLGQNFYGPFDWTVSDTNDNFSVGSGASLTGADGHVYSPRWSGGGLTAESLRETIDSELAAGRPIIASVQGSYTAQTHYVLVVGWTDDSHSDYLIVDPSGGGEGTIRDTAMAMTGGRGYTLGNRDGTYVYISFICS